MRKVCLENFTLTRQEGRGKIVACLPDEPVCLDSGREVGGQTKGQTLLRAARDMESHAHSRPDGTCEEKEEEKKKLESTSLSFSKNYANSPIIIYISIFEKIPCFFFNSVIYSNHRNSGNLIKKMELLAGSMPTSILQEKPLSDPAVRENATDHHGPITLSEECMSCHSDHLENPYLLLFFVSESLAKEFLRDKVIRNISKVQNSAGEQIFFVKSLEYAGW